MSAPTTPGAEDRAGPPSGQATGHPTAEVPAAVPTRPLPRVEPGQGTASGLGPWLARGLVVAPLQGLALTALAAVGAALLGLAAYALFSVALVVGLAAFPLVVAAVRWFADRNRRLVGHWLGEPVRSPYRMRLLSRTALRRPWRPFVDVVSDPATWRDLLWLATSVLPMALLSLLPALLVAIGLWGVLIPFVFAMSGGDADLGYYVVFFVDSTTKAWLSLAIGIAVLALAAWAGPRLLRVVLRHGQTLLRPTRSTELRFRVARLTETRYDAVDAQAAELRRIERDLHDGAQARLVALGLNLGTAEALLDHDPQAARALLAEARTASSKALEELRDLVRGIHPPVLADRGLGDAVRALALESPLAVEVAVRVPGRLDPAVESAAYFAVAEALANATKHARAERVWIDLRHVHGQLRATVVDDGVGGADPARGTGLAGMQRRLATFDGTLTVASPVGGPTVLTLELPCASSSPRTSSS